MSPEYFENMVSGNSNDSGKSKSFRGEALEYFFGFLAIFVFTNLLVLLLMRSGKAEWAGWYFFIAFQLAAAFCPPLYGDTHLGASPLGLPGLLFPIFFYVLVLLAISFGYTRLKRFVRDKEYRNKKYWNF